MQILNFVKFFLFEKTSKIILGRWKVTHDQKIIHSRIDWSNVDNCGCSGIQNK